MSRYVVVRLTMDQAHAAYNATDLIRDRLEADGEHKREAALYGRASDTIGAAINRAKRKVRK